MSVSCRVMQAAEVRAAAALALRVFDEWIAPDFPPEGVAEFKRYAEAAALGRRLAEGHLVVVAEEAGELVGMIEVRDDSHVAMLFVARPRRGVGRALLRHALQIARARSPSVKRITVHAATSAVSAYEHFGFHADGGERVENGIRYVPMSLPVGAVES